MDLSECKDIYVDVFDYPTRLMKFGNEPKSGDQMVVVVPGNPGLSEVYVNFLLILQKLLNMPVWIVSLLGHDDPIEQNDAQRLPTWRGNEHIYNIEGQAAHKIEFLRKYIPAGVKVHLVGHSIGSLICLKTIRSEEIRAKIQHCYLLFPALHLAAKSFKGILFSYLVMPLHGVILGLYKIYRAVPDCVRNFALQIYFYFDSIPTNIHHIIKKYLDSEPCVNKAYLLAADTMDKTVNLDIESIEKNRKVLSFYYGKQDGWVPEKCYHYLKDKFDDIDAVQCTRGIWHGFSLKHSAEMAEILAAKIKRHI